MSKISIILGSVRTDRTGIKIGKWIVSYLQDTNLRQVLAEMGASSIHHSFQYLKSIKHLIMVVIYLMMTMTLESKSLLMNLNGIFLHCENKEKKELLTSS